MRLGRVVFLAAATCMLAGAAAADDAVLRAAVASPDRTARSVARDQYCHPYDTLSFWGVKPHQNVLEIIPVGGYWAEILGPYTKATGGTYTATAPDLSSANEQAKKNDAAFRARFADESKYGKIRWQTWNNKGGAPLGPPASVDLVINSRYVHIWLTNPGEYEAVLKDIYAVLKPGGILAIEDHRADPRAQIPNAQDAYVSTAVVVDSAQKAGFKLEDSSEINANPKDTKDYTFGQWTLPPNLARKPPSFMVSWPGRPADDTLKSVEFYQAIGESDRMTLRFRKPR